MKVVEKTGGPFPKEDVIYTNIMREIVREAVYGLVDFKNTTDGLADYVLWADTNGDGKPELTITIDEMWAKVSDSINPTEIEQAKQWFVTSIATADRLKADGHQLSAEDCSKALSALVKQYGSPSYLDQFATKTLNFPSVECFKEYHCLHDKGGRYAALYRPTHMIGLELGISVASVALRGEPTGAPVCFNSDVVAVAKRPLRKGEILDGEGGFAVWGRQVPAEVSLAEGYLPLGLASDVALTGDIAEGQALRWSDVAIDASTDAVKVRREMEAMFARPRG